MELILSGNYSKVNPSVSKPFVLLDGGLSLPDGLFLSEDRNPLTLEEHHLRSVEKAKEQFQRALANGSYCSLQFLYLTWMKAHPDLVDSPRETALELIGGFDLDDSLDPVTTRSLYEDREPYLGWEELIERYWELIQPAYFYPDDFRSPNGKLDLFHMAYKMAENRPVYSRDCPMGNDLYHRLAAIALWHELLNPGKPFGLDQAVLGKVLDCSKMAVCKGIKRLIANGIIVKAPGSPSSSAEARRTRKVYTYRWVTEEVYSNRDVKIVGRAEVGVDTTPTGRRGEEKRSYRNGPASTNLTDSEFLKRFKRLKRRHGRGQYRAECPAHQDKTPSLDILILPDRRLVHCFACCEAEEIVEAVGLEMRHLFKNKDENPTLDNVLEFRRRKT